MVILKFIRLFWGDLYDYAQRLYSRSKIKNANPTCRFRKGSGISQATFGKYVVIFDYTNVYEADIGDYTYIQTCGRIFNCSIGKFCSIAANVSIAPGMHDLTKISTHPVFYLYTQNLPKIFVNQNKLEVCKRVHIGHDVWIGEKVTILDGVNIGNGAVIAAGAVVIKDVAPYSVVGGVPAKHIKYRFDEQTIEKIEESQWWDKSEDWLMENASYFLDVKQFLRKCD